MVGRRESSFNPPQSHPEPTEEEGLRSQMLSLTLEFQPTCEMRQVSVCPCFPNTWAMHSQHLPGYSTCAFPTVPFPFLPAVSNRSIPSQLLPCMSPGQRGKKHRASTSLELQARSSLPGGAPQTGRGISAGRKRRSSSPGQNRCFCSNEPSLVIPGCLKSMNAL